MPDCREKSLHFAVETPGPNVTNIVHWNAARRKPCGAGTSPAKIISHATDPHSSPCSHPRANGSPDPLPADSNFRLNCSCGTAPQNPSVVEIAQTATRPQTQHRFAMAP